MAVYSGEGTTVTVDAGALSGVISISIGAIEQAGVDNFHLGSTSKTQRAGLPDFGNVSLEFYFDDASAAQQALLTKSKSQADVDVVITFTSGGSVDVTGFVTSFEFSGMEVDSNLSATCEIKVNELTYAT